MLSKNYDKVVERISRETGLDISEINRRVDAKRAKLSDLISLEGAAQVVAVELGINFDKPEVKINEILTGMRKITVKGKIIKQFPVRTFKTKYDESKVTSFILADETGNVRCVLWDIGHIKLIEDGAIKEGSVVELKNASVREPGQDVIEVHLGSYGEIKPIDLRLDKVVTKQEMNSTTIDKLIENREIRIRGVIVQMFEPRFFYVCPECNGKMIPENGQSICRKHGSVIPKERMVISAVIDDGTGNIRASLFSESAEKLIGEMSEAKNKDGFIIKKQGILGSEYIFSGKARKNIMYNNLDFVVEELEEANPDEIINELRLLQK